MNWAELSYFEIYMGRVVQGRVVFGPSCPEPDSGIGSGFLFLDTGY